MELEQKKEMAYRFLKLGMPLYSAQILAEFTQEEMDDLEEDKSFQRQVSFVKQKEISRLLERIDSIIDMNTQKGVSTEIRWKLGKLDSAAFGEAAKFNANATDGKKKFNVVFEMSSDVNNDNVEEFVPNGTNEDKTI